MVFEEKFIKDEESGEEELTLAMLVCEYCGNKIEWYNIHRDYDNPTEEMIQTAKDTDGWVAIDIHKYDGDEEHPDSVTVCAIMKHACPECRENILQLDSEGNLI